MSSSKVGEMDSFELLEVARKSQKRLNSAIGDLDIIEFIKESNRIEGIHEGVTSDELSVYRGFLQTPKPDYKDVEVFVKCITGSVRQHETGGRLRIQDHMRVFVGDHRPPAGNVNMPDAIDKILEYARLDVKSPEEVHVLYESLHPFTDGNGRSGRVIYLWQLLHHDKYIRIVERIKHIGFLHHWYYASLSRINKQGRALDKPLRMILGVE